jgi:hypothetical protein
MNTYSEYNIIEKHIELSRELYSLNLIGKSIIKNIELSKHLRIKRSGNYDFSPGILIVYNAIIDMTNIKRFNKLRLYFCIQYYLDELLFKGIETLDNFYIEDECYKLTDLYFNQSLWNNDIDMNILMSSDNKIFNAEDIIVLKSYINRYIQFQETVMDYINTFDDIDYIKRKMMIIFNKMKLKILVVDMNI